MNDDQLDDLKQFFAANTSQLEQRLVRVEENLTKRIEGEVAELRQEMRAGFEGVGDAIEQIHKVTDNHESRITKLEGTAAV